MQHVTISVLSRVVGILHSRYLETNVSVCSNEEGSLVRQGADTYSEIVERLEKVRRLIVNVSWKAH